MAFNNDVLHIRVLWANPINIGRKPVMLLIIVLNHMPCTHVHPHDYAYNVNDRVDLLDHTQY